MKTTLLALLGSGVAALKHEPSYYERSFEEWRQQHGVTFATRADRERRFAIWCEKDDEIAEHNAKEAPYKLGHNQFSHLTYDEFAMDRKLGKYSNYAAYATKAKELKEKGGLRGAAEFDGDAVNATEVDWVKKGAVTPVKDQGQCGSCWAFSTTGSMEGAYYLKTGTLKSFSEELLVSCDTVDDGCGGGLMDNAFGWLKTNGGICLEADYPYTSGAGAVGKCQTSCDKVAGTAPTKFTDVAKKESALMAAVAKQPVSIAIEADKAAFQSYSSGVLTAACGTQLDHGVLVVGYGTLNGTPYWKVKNSWAATWGMEGYILLERGVTPTGECGILSDASFPSL